MTQIITGKNNLKLLDETRAEAEQRIQAARMKSQQAAQRFSQAQAEFNQFQDAMAQEILEARGMIKAIDLLLGRNGQEPIEDSNEQPSS